jgi:hypothetical protein
MAMMGCMSWFDTKSTKPKALCWAWWIWCQCQTTTAAVDNSPWLSRKKASLKKSILNFFTDSVVPDANLEPGTILIWNKNKNAPWMHTLFIGYPTLTTKPPNKESSNHPQNLPPHHS